MIETDEYATAFIGAGIVQMIVFAFISAAANGIYNATVNFFPGLIFLIFAGVELLPILIMRYDCYSLSTSWKYSLFSFLALLEWKTSRKVNRKRDPNLY